jgi:hypothetical protein
VRAERGEERRRSQLADDEQRGTDRHRYPERLSGQTGGALGFACAARTRDDRGRSVRQEVEDRERAGEDRPRKAERCDLRPAQVAHDRGVGEHVERLGRQGP